MIIWLWAAVVAGYCIVSLAVALIVGPWLDRRDDRIPTPPPEPSDAP